MSRIRQTRYSTTTPTPTPPRTPRPTGPIPPALWIILRQAIRGVGKEAFVKQVKNWDWQSEANDKIEEIQREFLADVLVETFLNKGLGAAIRHGIDDEWAAFRTRVVEILNQHFDTFRAQVEDDRFMVEYDEVFKLKLSFQAWGDLANRDNPDEGANFDLTVDDAIRDLFGKQGVRISHTFEEGWDDRLYFVWDCKVDYLFDPAAVLRAMKNGELTLIRRLAEQAAARAEC